MYFFLSGFFEGMLSYSDPLLSIPLLLVPVLTGTPFEPPSVLLGLSLVGSLSLSGLQSMNRGLDSAANLLSVFRRVQKVLVLPEYSSKRAPPAD